MLRKERKKEKNTHQPEWNMSLNKQFSFPSLLRDTSPCNMVLVVAGGLWTFLRWWRWSNHTRWTNNICDGQMISKIMLAFIDALVSKWKLVPTSVIKHVTNNHILLWNGVSYYSWRGCESHGNEVTIDWRNKSQDM